MIHISNQSQVCALAVGPSAVSGFRGLFCHTSKLARSASLAASLTHIYFFFFSLPLERTKSTGGIKVKLNETIWHTEYQA